MGAESFAGLATELRNPATADIDKAGTLEMLAMINDEDAKCAAAVRAELPNIAMAVDAVAAAFCRGGRLFYVGAGTSGRIGVLDASEIPPTFGAPPDMVTALIAGGRDAVFAAKEGAEDDESLGAADIAAHGVGPNDVVVGIAASGRTPYVLGAVRAAREAGAVTVGLSNAPGSRLGAACDIAITPVTGPEAVTGSTRMKAGTSQKMVLNMLTTGAMIKTGKTYGNLMVDVTPTNEKLRDRASRIVDAATGAGRDRAEAALLESGGNPKLAIVMIRTGLEAGAAKKLLDGCGGFVRKAVEGC